MMDAAYIKAYRAFVLYTLAYSARGVLFVLVQCTASFDPARIVQCQTDSLSQLLYICLSVALINRMRQGDKVIKNVYNMQVK